MARPEIVYAWNGDAAIAYSVSGQDQGPDLLHMAGYTSNIDLMWDNPRYARFLERLGSFSRLILTDRRGWGCSERASPGDVAPLETVMEDALAVLDAVGSTSAHVFASADVTMVAALLAAAHPDRVAGLQLYAPMTTWVFTPETPWEWTREEWQVRLDEVRTTWGTAGYLDVVPALLRDDPIQREWFLRYMRMGVAPGALISETWKFVDTDLRDVLPAIRVPTLVIGGEGLYESDGRASRYVASHVEGARLLELDAGNKWEWFDERAPYIDEVEEMVSGTLHAAPSNTRVLATVVFTDIVGSTERAARLATWPGPTSWPSMTPGPGRRSNGRTEGGSLPRATGCSRRSTALRGLSAARVRYLTPYSPWGFRSARVRTRGRSSWPATT
ncbi:MAG: alpha/beta hydrolase [Actinomycetota bacterium]|nr:alpha/beta hydrolase [Actinomycetota bacterium]